MPVPTSISDLTPVASTNSPQGSESVKGTIDDYIRVHGAFIRQIFNQTLGPTVNLAAAPTLNIGFAASLNIYVVGGATITAFDNYAEGTLRWLIFSGASTLVHNGGSLVLPGVANILTAAGDVALFKSLGNGNWQCLTYQRFSGTGPVAASAAKDGYLSAADWSSFASRLTPAAAAAAYLRQDVAAATYLSQAAAAASYMPQGGGSFTGNVVFNNNTGLFFRDTGGVAHQTFVYSADNNLYTSMPVGGYIKWLSVSGAQIAQLDNGGGFSAVTVTQTSDERKKKLWQRLPKDFIAQLAGLKKSGLFTWKKGGALGVGVGAQSLERILPTAVHTDDRGAKTVNYGAAAMVSCVELARALVAQEKRLAALEAK
jgi:hypothetical protein